MPPLPTIIKKEGGKGDTSSSIKGGAGLIDGPSDPGPVRPGRRSFQVATPQPSTDGGHMTRRWRAAGDDRGAVLIHVALGVLALAAFTTFVADYGLMWTSRRQAQNSADAGALAGITAFAFDEPGNYSDTGMTKLSAYAATQGERVSARARERVRGVFTRCPFCERAAPRERIDKGTLRDSWARSAMHVPGRDASRISARCQRIFRRCNRSSPVAPTMPDFLP